MAAIFTIYGIIIYVLYISVRDYFRWLKAGGIKQYQKDKNNNKE